MSTAAAPALETGGTSPAPVSSTSSASPAAVDPIDALDFSNLNDTSTDVEEAFPIPDSMLLGGKREPAEAAPGKAAERTDGRNADGTFAEKATEKGAEKTTDDPANPTDPTAANTTSPFKYRAMGNTHELEGATINEKGDITVPAAKSAELREAFNALHLAKGHFQPVLDRKEAENVQLRARVAEMETGRTANDTKAGQLVDRLSALMTEPDPQKALDQIWALRSAWPQLIANAERDHALSEVERLKKAPTAATPAPTRAPQNTNNSSSGMPTADDAKATTREYVEQLKVDHGFRDITPELWKQVEAEVERTPFAFLRLATAEDAKTHGVQPGTTVFDTDLLVQHVTTKRTESTKARETAQDQTRLAVENARRTQPSVQAPPTPGKGSSAPAKKSGSGIKTKQDFENWLDSDEI